jgi:hypothetical protein
MKLLFTFLSLSFFSVPIFAQPDSGIPVTIDTSKVQPLLNYNTKLTAVADFIGGKSTTTFQAKQSAAYYAEHQKFVKNTWQMVTDSTIVPVTKWAKEKKIIEVADTLTVFYPFSGPDFLFADIFFPNATNYIMMGLERIGTVPPFESMSEESLKAYVSGIQTSLKYLNMSGYFVTQHMGKDFSKKHLNGNLHMMLYFMARTNHKIMKVEHVALDKKGNASIYTPSKGTPPSPIKGVKVTFCDSTCTVQKTAWYFSFDAADRNMTNNPHFVNFMKQQPPYNTYIKSASYILASTKFNIVRNLILDYSDKIVQDDTGVPYKYFTKDKFDLQMWGLYSRTIDALSWGYQKELQTVLEASEHNKPLPFKISYNGRRGEGMMMYGRKKKETGTNK